MAAGSWGTSKALCHAKGSQQEEKKEKERANHIDEWEEESNTGLAESPRTSSEWQESHQRARWQRYS